MFDRLARRLVEVGVAPDGADEAGDARGRLLELREHDARAGAGREEAEAGGEAVVADPRRDAIDPLAAEPRLRERGRDLERVRKAALRERLAELLLAIALGERIETLARRRLLGGLGAQRAESGELLRRRTGSRDLGEGGLSLPLVLAQRRGRSGRGGGGVVQLVREPGGELAHRQQLLAVALDPLDRAAHRLDRGEEPAEQRGVGEREPAEFLPVQLEQERLGDGAGAPAVGGVREQRHRAEEAARPVADHQDLLAGDLPGRLQLALEHDVEVGRALALVEEVLAR